MVVHTDSDASYLCAPKAKSRAAGYHYLSSHPDKLQPGEAPPLNGPIHVLCAFIGPVVASAAEAEVAGNFMNAQELCPIRQTLIFLGHPQPPTPIRTDNKCAEGILNGTIKQRRSKAIDMRFYWLQDRVKQGQYQIVWGPGKNNHGDYFSKHFPPSHHKEVRPIYLHVPPQSAHHIGPPARAQSAVGGCVEVPVPPGPGPHVHSSLANAAGPSTTDCLTRFTVHDAGDLHDW
jgi:hypothetical protein